METKTNLISAVNGFLTAIITQSKVRDAQLEVIDEIYPDAVTDSQATETYTTKSGTNLNYTISLLKSGNKVLIKGTITNTTTLALSAQNVFTWKDTEFRPKSGVNDFTFRAIYGTSNNINLFINNNVLALTSSINALGSYSFEFVAYIAQD